ncbi:hypothetical protein LOD99_7909 [Oopsacas minuta]|uniref:Uncharacterized protein n=1 Tax=Oopsacas minuta TaxID=111878 RepID=A0AAV7JIZ0_9METZ|nr:hypothetical protein LOD99_7909 [Oopsacas minuta]
MSNLTLLFEQILNTEQEFQKKSNELKKLSCSLQSGQKDLKQIKDRMTSLIGENIIRNNQLGFELGELMGSNNQCKILIEQKKVLEAGDYLLKAEIDLKKTELITLNRNFITRSKQFSSLIQEEGMYTKHNSKRTEVERLEIENTVKKRRAILDEIKDREIYMIHLGDQILTLEGQNLILTRQVELSYNNTQKLENLILELEKEREEVDKNHLQYEFKEIQQKLEQVHRENTEKERELHHVKNEIECLKSIKHQEELHNCHVYHKRQLIQQNKGLRGDKISKDFPIHFYNPYRSNSESIQNCNELPVRGEGWENQQITIKDDEQVDWSGLSDFEELD